jgi:hypothetical protein
LSPVKSATAPIAQLRSTIDVTSATVPTLPSISATATVPELRFSVAPPVRVRTRS